MNHMRFRKINFQFVILILTNGARPLSYRNNKTSGERNVGG